MAAQLLLLLALVASVHGFAQQVVTFQLARLQHLNTGSCLVPDTDDSYVMHSVGCDGIPLQALDKHWVMQPSGDKQGVYVIQHLTTGRVLNVQANNKVNAELPSVINKAIFGDYPNWQRWLVEQNQIKSLLYPSKCLQMVGNDVQLTSCSTGDVSTMWRFLAPL